MDILLYILFKILMYVSTLVLFYYNNQHFIWAVVLYLFVILVSLLAFYYAAVLTLKAIKLLDPNPWNGPFIIKVSYVLTCILAGYIARAYALDILWMIIDYIFNK